MQKTITKCSICHNEITDKFKSVRLIQQIYTIKGYGYYNKQIGKNDLCLDCFKIYKRWLNKHKEDKE